MKIRDLNNKLLMEKEVKYRNFLNSLRSRGSKASKQYETVYRIWFMLREAGVNRKLWNFVPAPEKNKTLS